MDTRLTGKVALVTGGSFRDGARPTARYIRQDDDTELFVRD
jgi:hypothetical protein